MENIKCKILSIKKNQRSELRTKLKMREYVNRTVCSIKLICGIKQQLCKYNCYMSINNCHAENNSENRELKLGMCYRYNIPIKTPRKQPKATNEV